MKFRYGLYLLLGLSCFATYADAKQEINHLLAYVAATDCQYERNGKMHQGNEAKKHIQKKYDYFEDDIKTAEDFILLAATKSKMSGKYYKIHCSGQTPIKSQDWLLAELKRYRDTFKKND